MNTLIKATLLTVAMLGSALPALAHDDELRTETVKPRIGVMSELVAKQKLATYGITNVNQLRLEGDRYVIQATYDNKPVQLEMHSQTGLLSEKGSRVPLQVAPSVQERVIRNHFIQLDRQQLIRPERLRINP